MMGRSLQQQPKATTTAAATATTCEAALAAIYVSDYERSKAPCTCQEKVNQTIVVTCNRYEYCQECLNESAPFLDEPLCGVQSNTFTIGESAEYCVKFGAAGVESNICLSEKGGRHALNNNNQENDDYSCTFTVDGQACRSCRQITCPNSGDATDIELDCSNLVNEWGADARCQLSSTTPNNTAYSAYNPVASFSGGSLSFAQCYTDPVAAPATTKAPVTAKAPVTKAPITKAPVTTKAPVVPTRPVTAKAPVTAAAPVAAPATAPVVVVAPTAAPVVPTAAAQPVSITPMAVPTTITQAPATPGNPRPVVSNNNNVTTKAPSTTSIKTTKAPSTLAPVVASLPTTTKTTAPVGNTTGAPVSAPSPTTPVVVTVTAPTLLSTPSSPIPSAPTSVVAGNNNNNFNNNGESSSAVVTGRTTIGSLVVRLVPLLSAVLASSVIVLFL
jgi:hypothetical protein